MAQAIAISEIEYTSTLLTRILTHLVGKLSTMTGVPDLTGTSRRLLHEWCDGIVPREAVVPLSLNLVEAAIDIVGIPHPLTRADSTQRYARCLATDLYASPHVAAVNCGGAEDAEIAEKYMRRRWNRRSIAIPSTVSFALSAPPAQAISRIAGRG